MPRNPASVIVRFAASACAILGVACHDHIPSAPARVTGASDQIVSCQADVRAHTVSCAASGAPVTMATTSGFAADVIVGGQNTNVLLKSSHVSYDATAQIFQADVTVQNLMTPTLGTADGNTVSGVKVFFHAGPNVVSGSGTVTVANADGMDTFTGTNQPFFLYSEMLPTGKTSAAKTWQWAVPPTVTSFTFDVLVDAPTAPPRATTCMTQAGPTITLTGVHTTEYHNPSLANTKVDASTAQFMTGSNFPVRVSGAHLCWHGGKIIGQLPPSTSWPTMIKTFAILVDTGTNATVEDFTMFDYGNGVSLQQNAPNYTVRSGYYIYDRDGCVENDYALSGTIDDVYMECYSPIADAGGFAGVDGRNNLVTLKNSLVHLQPMDGVFKGSIPGTVGIFEWGTPSDSTSPHLALYNNVFRVDQNSVEPYLAPPPGKLVDCANNVMIWLGSGPFPVTLPLTFNGRPCYTLMTGQSGLDFWNAAVAKWRADHPSLLPDIAPPVVSLFSPGIVGSSTLTGTVNLTATAADDWAVGGVQLQMNGQNIGAEILTPSPLTKYTLTWDSTTLPNGTYTLTAVARDTSGHSTTSAGIAVTISN
jgi:Big-like domain-containing protein